MRIQGNIGWWLSEQLELLQGSENKEWGPVRGSGALWAAGAR